MLLFLVGKLQIFLCVWCEREKVKMLVTMKLDNRYVMVYWEAFENLQKMLKKNLKNWNNGMYT